MYKKVNTLQEIEFQYCVEFCDNIICASIDKLQFYFCNNNTKIWMLQYPFDIIEHFLINVELTNEQTMQLNQKRIASTVLKIANTFYKPNYYTFLRTNKIISVNNGVVDLITGEYRQRVRKDNCLSNLSTNWMGLNYETFSIDKFFDDITLFDSNFKYYLQKLLGSCFCESYDFNVHILYGNGSNGKLTLIFMLMELLENLMSQIDACYYDDEYIYKTLLCTKIALIKNESLDNIKKFIACLNNNVNILGVLPTFKLFAIINTVDDVQNDDFIVPIHFPAEFKSIEEYNMTNNKHKLCDPTIMHMFRDKKEELLVWLVKGAIKFNKEGINKNYNIDLNIIEDYVIL